jgi:negative regulator of sigma E activity
MKFMKVLTAFVFSTGLAYGAETPVVEPQDEAPAVAPASDAAPAKKAATPAQLAQREKMRVCNAEAKKQELKGDDRKKFMSDCLKKGDDK